MLAFLWIALLLIVGYFVINKNYTKGQLVSLAQSAGFSVDEANIAAAIALAESGGNPRAYDPETQAGNPPGQGSFGLWQINLHAHPQFLSLALYNPTANAQAAFEVYQEQGWHAWSTYSSGAYEQFL